MKKKTFEELYTEVIKFNKARGWAPVPSDCAKSVVIEGAELLEHFQWDNTDLGLGNDKNKKWDEIGSEVADVLWYLISFCEYSGLNITDVLTKKIAKNEIKYPSEKFNGQHNEQFYREQKKKYREEKRP